MRSDGILLLTTPGTKGIWLLDHQQRSCASIAEGWGGGGKGGQGEIEPKGIRTGKHVVRSSPSLVYSPCSSPIALSGAIPSLLPLSLPGVSPSPCPTPTCHLTLHHPTFNSPLVTVPLIFFPLPSCNCFLHSPFTCQYPPLLFLLAVPLQFSIRTCGLLQLALPSQANSSLAAFKFCSGCIHMDSSTAPLAAFH